MTEHRKRLWPAAMLFVLAATAAMADGNGNGEEAKAEDRIAETTHSIEIGGEWLAYRAKAGTLVMREENGDPKANIFFIAYEKLGVENPETRPITFSFNGGPGSSSVWLHLGLLGPKRVHMDSNAEMMQPPFEMRVNEYSLLDQTDMVFIDPVTTGYSRAAEGESDKQFHGVNEDIRSVGDFIRLFVTREARWASPKFLIGESYGTTRAAGLSGYLQDRHGMYLNGIMLISSILDFQTARFDPGNGLPYILFLPTYAATAWYHKKLPPELLDLSLDKVLRRAEEFAARDYTLALMKGDALAGDERRRTAETLAGFTGLSVDFVERCNLRVEIFQFTKELLRDERRTAGRLDSRYTGIDRDAAGESFEFDPSMAAIEGPYTAMLNDYVRRELEFESDLPYEILTGRVHPWNYGDYQNRYVNVAETLRRAMTKNPYLRVFVASGYYDLATPYFATDYTLDHMQLDPSLQGNIEKAYYEAGHMMYIHQPSLARMRDDLTGFLRSALPPR